MGKSLEQILPDLTDGSRVGVTIVSNQDNGLASYSTGELVYHSEAVFPGTRFTLPARLSTSDGQALKIYFSDRLLDIDAPAPQGSFGHNPRQPFSANAIDRLGVSIALTAGPRTMRLTFVDWGGASANIVLEPCGDLLVGLGPSLGHSAPGVYLASFFELPPGPR